jgi:hypothetical protein
MKTSWLSVALLVVLAGCGAREPGAGSSSSLRENHKRITVEEVRMGPQSSAYDLVLALRPQWLRTRGPTSLGGTTESPVQVYLDGVRLGGVNVLRRISVPTVDSFQFMDPIEASSRWGFGHDNGAIMIISRR